jgi:hypothetical protein
VCAKKIKGWSVKDVLQEVEELNIIIKKIN